MPKLKHYEVENHCYLVTATTEGRKGIFADKANCQILCNLIYNLRARGRLLLVGFVIMPEHFHTGRGIRLFFSQPPLRE